MILINEIHESAKKSESDSIRGLEQSTFFSTVIGSIKPIATI